MILLSAEATAQPDYADVPFRQLDPINKTPITATVEPGNAGSGRIDNMLMHALSLIGVKYRSGGNRLEQGFDCSGFVRHVFAEALSVELPRSSIEMSRLGNPVENNQLLPGDLLFYNTLKRRFSHVGIYLGEGRFVHAPSPGKNVEIVDMSDAYWKKRFDGARRLVDPD